MLVIVGGFRNSGQQIVSIALASDRHNFKTYIAIVNALYDLTLALSKTRHFEVLELRLTNRPIPQLVPAPNLSRGLNRGSQSRHSPSRQIEIL